MQRLCKYCGAEYSGDPGSAACPDCVAKLRSTTIRPRVCRACGVTFPGGPRAWYCPSCRAERQRAHDLAYKRRAKAGTARKIGSEDICEICGGAYVVTSGLQRYCPACAPDAIREIDRQQSIAWNRANITPEQRRAERQASSAPMLCAVCGKPFVPDSSGHTCSKECKAAYAKMRAAAWERENRERRNQYRRDLRRVKHGEIDNE